MLDFLDDCQDVLIVAVLFAVFGVFKLIYEGCNEFRCWLASRRLDKKRKGAAKAKEHWQSRWY